MSKVDIFGDKYVREGGVLIIPNKLSAKDLLALENVIGSSRITYVLLSGHSPSKEIMSHLGRPEVAGVMLSPEDPNPEAVGESLKPMLDQGKVLVYIPGDSVYHKGTMNVSPVRVLDYLCQLGLPIAPLFVGYYGDFGEKREDESVVSTALGFKPTLSRRGMKALALLLQAWYEAGEEAMSGRSEFDGSLASAVVRGMKENSRCKIIDGVDDQEMTYGVLLGVAIAFSKRLKELTKKKRIGIVLPPGKGATLANLACLLAGKVPVNINFTVSEDSIKSSFRQAEMDRFITAGPFLKKFPGFPWPSTGDLILLDKEAATLKKSAARWVVLSRMLPAGVLIRMLDLDAYSGDDEAVLLFTSGSSGEPKGVVLSHRNMLGNVAQCRARIYIERGQSLLGSLPIFHSFGVTVTMWFPLICGYNVVTYPSPTEVRRLGELIEKHKVVLAVMTPTFLRAFVKRVPVENLKSIKHMIVGAEKLPPALGDAFYDKFGFYPVEGYGLTETTPVCSVNMLTPEDPEDGRAVIPANKNGSVGELLPGLAIRITDPNTDEPFPITKTGMIWFKGVNVFSGYLRQDELNHELIKDGWFKTGDIGHLDPEGFLHIEGRMSRFSKIGGEMVPHEQLEIAIVKALEIDPADSERHIAVVRTADKQKGEAIALLSTLVGPSAHQELLALRYKLLDLGLPALWCPKYLLAVPAIPILPSGKLNIIECEAIVEKARAAGEL